MLGGRAKPEVDKSWQLLSARRAADGFARASERACSISVEAQLWSLSGANWPRALWAGFNQQVVVATSMQIESRASLFTRRVGFAFSLFAFRSLAGRPADWLDHSSSAPVSACGSLSVGAPRRLSADKDQ